MTNSAHNDIKRWFLCIYFYFSWIERCIDLFRVTIAFDLFLFDSLLVSVEVFLLKFAMGVAGILKVGGGTLVRFSKIRCTRRGKHFGFAASVFVGRLFHYYAVLQNCRILHCQFRVGRFVTAVMLIINPYLLGTDWFPD